MPSIVLELQGDALSNAVPVTTLLRKTFLVATKLGLDQFRQWAEWEMNGYPDGVQLPPYRNIRGQIEARNPVRGWIPVIFATSEDAELLSQRGCAIAIPELEALLKNGRPTTLSMPLPHDQQELLNAGQRRPMVMAFRCSSAAVDALMSATRDTILKWTLQLEQEGILGEGLTFSSSEKSAAASGQSNVVNHFYGAVSHSQLNSHTTNPTQFVIGAPRTDQLSEFVANARRQVDALSLSAPLRQEFEAELGTLDAQLKSPNPKSSIIREAGGSLLRILEGAAGSVGGELLMQLISALGS